MVIDLVDSEDQDQVNIQKKKHFGWEMFGEQVYSWDSVQNIVLPRRLSPNRSTWKNVEALNSSWYDLTDASFERRKKKASWRFPSLGLRIYQMNKYRPSNSQIAQRPHTLMIDSWSIGYKPMRKSRI